ncbi:MAG TPA: hypothetical protein VGR35_12865 [Tepidisphaeraceae bacterium]|nr:hypothetical protein [Tepidisphaeraceae bacterium]
MFGKSNPFKTCRFCLLALAIPLSYFSLAATGLIAPAGQSVAQAAEAAQEVSEATQTRVDAVVGSYLELQNLLAQDKIEGIDDRLSEIRRSAKELTDAQEQKVGAQAKTVQKHAAVEPENLREAREALKSLSAAVIGLVHLVPPSSEVAPALYEATCPMAKANWLQTSKDLKNPYMGKSMLKCGSIERTIKEPAGGTEQTERAAASVGGGGSCCSMGR